MHDIINFLRNLEIDIKYNFNGGDEMLTIDNNTDKQSLKSIELFCKKNGLIFKKRLENTIIKVVT